MINGSALRLSRSLISVCTAASSSDPTPSLTAAHAFALPLPLTIIPPSFLVSEYVLPPSTLPMTGQSVWLPPNCCRLELCHLGSCCIVSENGAYGTWTGKWVCEDTVSVWLQHRAVAACFIWEKDIVHCTHQSAGKYTLHRVVQGSRGIDV